MSASMSPTFLADLAEVYDATLRPPTLSAAFPTDLEQVYALLPLPLPINLSFLAERFMAWRRQTQEELRIALARVPEDDPIRCPISLFRTMDYGRLETAHTRTLAWLLDREGEHGFGNRLLAALLRRFVGDRSGSLVVERVVSEYLIDGSGDRGRLDVLAEGAWEENSERVGWVLVIEAKVDASEGEGQLDKYDDWLRVYAADRQVFRVFLTPDGRVSETGAEEWESLSYLELVRIFRAAYSGLRHAPGFHFMRFYLAGVLQDICGWPQRVGTDVSDPYAILSYLNAVQDGP